MLAFALMAAAFGQTSPPPRLISVNGTGRITVDPDLAIVRVAVETQLPAARAAQERTNTEARRAIEAIVSAGIPRTAIQTSGIQLYAVGGTPGDPQPTAYVARISITVRVEDVSRAGQVLDVALENGANRIDGISFGLRDESAARQQALRAAVADARAKADAIAQALGVGVGLVFDVSEGGGVSFAPRMEAMMTRDMGTPVEPGQLTVEASVMVRYNIQLPG
jgi:uncharacterized protein